MLSLAKSKNVISAVHQGRRCPPPLLKKGTAMTIYIYVPIMTPESEEIVRKWNISRSAKALPPLPLISVGDRGFEKAVRRNIGEGRLKGILPTDEIWLLSHGLCGLGQQGALVIGNDRRDASKQYTAARLARSLEEEGLTKGFRQLRLLACRAAMAGIHVGAPTLPFAQRLKQSLTSLGYLAVSVSAFRGDIIADHAEYFAFGEKYNHPSTVVGHGLTLKVAGQSCRQNALLHMQTF